LFWEGHGICGGVYKVKEFESSWEDIYEVWEILFGKLELKS
jgi:DNA gyrase inhibitor GyrI